MITTKHFTFNIGFWSETIKLISDSEMMRNIHNVTLFSIYKNLVDSYIEMAHTSLSIYE